MKLVDAYFSRLSLSGLKQMVNQEIRLIKLWGKKIC